MRPQNRLSTCMLQATKIVHHSTIIDPSPNHMSSSHSQFINNPYRPFLPAVPPPSLHKQFRTFRPRFVENSPHPSPIHQQPKSNTVQQSTPPPPTAKRAKAPPGSKSPLKVWPFVLILGVGGFLFREIVKQQEGRNNKHKAGSNSGPL